ncbi:MAG: FHA domain-containing protein [Ruminococcaceae bacterium]|nr:FHA domain-containing protein [Oscillospiraceae bacterium]
MEIVRAIGEFLQSEKGQAMANVFTTCWRFFAPAIAILILWSCIYPLLRFRREPETWGWLLMPDGRQVPVTHWESIIGRAKNSDISINFPTVSRSHAVLTRFDDGSWSITDIGSRGAVSVNGTPVSVCAVNYGDTISLGGLEIKLLPVTAQEMENQRYSRTRPNQVSIPWLTLLLLTVFQGLTLCQLFTSCEPKELSSVVLAFTALVGLQWVLYFLLRLMRRTGFEVETIAFFLCTIGLSVIASSAPKDMIKQTICIFGGIVIYFIISWSLRDLSRAKSVRYMAAVAGVLLLLVNLLIGQEINGARNWIAIGPMSFQPSEIVKLCFILVGASTMDRIVTKRNLISFIAYTVLMCGCLALMKDFGAALIFFVTFLVIAFMRSGSFATIALAVMSLVFAVLILIMYFEDYSGYIQRRFSVWGNVWDDPYNMGYQQVRAMMCLASGGLLGLGAGNGWLHHVAAADTDLVFAFVGEEWGLLIAIACVLAIAALSVFVFRSCVVARSSFYTIAACSAVTVLLMQSILNVFGTMDLLPLTGVTLPFVSNGGSSMLCCWGLLAFIKSVDTRQNASVAVKAVDVEEVEYE